MNMTPHHHTTTTTVVGDEEGSRVVVVSPGSTECAICLESIENSFLPIVCERGHPLHPKCFRELVRSRPQLNERVHCPSCRGVFLCMMCENGAYSRVLCIFCATEKLLRYDTNSELIITSATNRGNALRNLAAVISGRRTRRLASFNKVFEIIQQHAIIFGIWVGISNCLKGCLKSNPQFFHCSYHVIIFVNADQRHNILDSGDETSVEMLKLLFEFSCFINLHFNIWVCCDRILDILISDSVFLQSNQRIKGVHHAVKSLICGVVLARTIGFVYESICIYFICSNE